MNFIKTGEASDVEMSTRRVERRQENITPKRRSLRSSNSSSSDDDDDGQAALEAVIRVWGQHTGEKSEKSEKNGRGES